MTVARAGARAPLRTPIVMPTSWLTGKLPDGRGKPLKCKVFSLVMTQRKNLDVLY